MKLIAILTAAATAAILVATVGQAGARQSEPAARAAPVAENPAANQYHHVAVRHVAAVEEVRTAVWACQRSVELPVTPAGLDRAGLRAAGWRYLIWIRHQWAERLAACRLVVGRTLPAAGDWLTAVHVVQRVYPGSEWWLRSCSSGEGGWGRWVPNTQGSGAGGWMQYMEGTFWHDFNRAAEDLTLRKIRFPRSAASWYSPLGQAIAAGWAYGHDRPAGKWWGGGC